MITAFIIRAIVASSLLTGAAFAAERVVACYGRARRWMWVSAILASLVLPAAMQRMPALFARNSLIDRPAQLIDALQPLRPVAIRPARVEWRGTGDAVSGVPFITADRAALLGWLGASLALFVCVSAGYWRIRRERTNAEPVELEGVVVHIAERTGPAVIGILHPVIVVPGWVLNLPVEERRLIVLHEREHVVGHDPWLLAFATLAVIVMPWNVLLWWQHLRLRLAVETDCDARVVACGADRERYGRTLIRTAGGALGLSILAPAWGESALHLRKRILAMTERPPRRRFAVAATCTALSGALTLIACEASAPTRPQVTAAPATVVSGSASSAPAVRTAPNYVRVTGYANDHVAARVVLTGSGDRLSVQSSVGATRVSGDTLVELVTPAVLRIDGKIPYQIVAIARDSGAQVEIASSAPSGLKYGMGAAARGPAPMLNFLAHELEAVPGPRPPGMDYQHDPFGGPSRLVADMTSEPERTMITSLALGHMRVQSEGDASVRVRVSATIPFTVVSAAATYRMSDGSVELSTPVEISVTEATAYAVVFDPVDPAADVHVVARGQMGSYSAVGGAIAVCRSVRGAGIRGGLRHGAQARAVDCK